MKKLNLIIIALLLNTFLLSAQNNFFKTPENSQLTKKKMVLSNIRKKRVYSLDEKAMRSYLRTAPVEFKNNGVTIPLDIPLPDGTVETFNMVESPVLSAEIAAQNPNIKTYTGSGKKDKKASISLSLTSRGFNAIILNVGNETVYFDSYSEEKNNIYFNYFVKDVIVPEGEKSKSCLVESEDEVQIETPLKKGSNRMAATSATATSSGTQLRTYRLAIAATGEFTEQYGNYTKVDGLAAVVAYVTRIRAIFRVELAVDLTLVSGENLIYTNATTDPYNQKAANLNSELTVNQNNINTIVGVGNYDIGHHLGYTPGSGQGLAVSSAVCDNTVKGRGLSYIGSVDSYSQVFMDNLILHEMGHQFGMSHSYNSVVDVCTSRNAATSVEPGSGATIMSYGFICGTDNAAGTPYNALLQYHKANYEQAMTYINLKTCKVVTATGNTPPVVTVPAGYTIPKSTPFILTGSATDIDAGDVLTYCWEGTDIGNVTPDATTLDDTTKPPFFRSYAPSTSPSRTYPVLGSIINGTNQDKGDKLPSIDFVTKHTLTVRDNKATGGGVNSANLTVTIDATIGPFLITSNSYPVINVLTDPVVVTWSVNGTDVATPAVNILLSIDGGLTFTRTLASGVPNNGSRTVYFPSIPNTIDNARIKVEAVGNIFFDISNTNIVIRQPMSIAFSGTNVTPAGGATGSVTATASGGRNTFNYAASYNFTNGPYNIDNALQTFSTIVLPPLPAGATMNNATLNFVTVSALGASWINDIRAALSGAYTLLETQIASGLTGTRPTGSANLPNFITTGGSISLLFSDFNPDNDGIEARITSANISINYAKNGYTYLWSTGATTPTITGLVAGDYTVTATDAFGNNVTRVYTISNDYSITASSDANGTISPAGISTVVRNGSKTYNFTPNSCFRIVNVVVNGSSIGAVTNYTFNNVTSNQTIRATFVSSSIVNMTPVTACSDYTWTNNNQVYTTSGIYIGTTTNCITEQLNLTISSTTWNGTVWSSGIPDINTKAIINGSYAQATNLTACSLDIIGNAIVTVPAGFNFTISGKVTVSPTASLTFENNTNLIQIENSQNQGSITVKRNSNPLKRLDYTLWSSPVTNANQFLTTFSPLTTTNRFYTYNETTNVYNAIINPNTTPFSLGTGYLIRVANTHPETPTIWTGSFTGIPNNGLISRSVTNNTFNAIGNPYPSSINANAFIDANVLTEPLYFWRKTNNAAYTSYATYTKAGGAANSGGLSSIVPNGIIQVGQGFITKSASSTLTFNNLMRIANNDNQFLKTKALERHRIWLNLSKEAEPVNQIMVAYLSGATAGIDPGIDGRYFGDSEIALNSSIENQEFVIQAKGLPFENTDVIALIFKTSAQGNYSISIDHVDGLFSGSQDIFIKDNLLGLTENLKEKSYSFASATGIFDTRFELIYKSNGNLGLDRNELEANKIIVYKENGLLKINSGTTIMKNVRVFDIQGRLLFKQENINQNTTVCRNFKATKQTVIVQITSIEDNEVTIKVLY